MGGPSATIRHVGICIDMVIQGAMAKAEYGPDMSEDEYRLQVFRAVAKQVGGWMESETPAFRLEVAQCIDDELVHADLGSGAVTDEDADQD